jgi:hypothetical protein
MQDRRFDDLTRGLAASSTRRQALKALGGGAAGALLSVFGLRSAAAKPKAPDKKKPDCCPKAAPTLCGRTCVDVATDPSHCGGCGAACIPGGTCSDGACIAPPCVTSADCIQPADPCQASVCTEGVCVLADRCPPESTCAGGVCTCPAGTTYCAAQNVCVADCLPFEPLNPQTCQCDPHFCPTGSPGCINIPCNQNADGQRCYCQLTIDGESACVVFPEGCNLQPCHTNEQCPAGSVCVDSDCCDDGPVCRQLCV